MMKVDSKRWDKRLKTTPWFEYPEKPVYVGIYQILCPHTGLEIAYSYWSGKYWGVFAYNIPSALRLSITKSFDGKFKWRGLAEQQGVMKNVY
jgi:hypothetical protein